MWRGAPSAARPRVRAWEGPGRGPASRRLACSAAAAAAAVHAALGGLLLKTHCTCACGRPACRQAGGGGRPGQAGGAAALRHRVLGVRKAAARARPVTGASRCRRRRCRALHPSTPMWLLKGGCLPSCVPASRYPRGALMLQPLARIAEAVTMHGWCSGKEGGGAPDRGLPTLGRQPGAAGRPVGVAPRVARPALPPAERAVLSLPADPPYYTRGYASEMVQVQLMSHLPSVHSGAAACPALQLCSTCEGASCAGPAARAAAPTRCPLPPPHPHARAAHAQRDVPNLVQCEDLCRRQHHFLLPAAVRAPHGAPSLPLWAAGSAWSLPVCQPARCPCSGADGTPAPPPAPRRPSCANAGWARWRCKTPLTPGPSRTLSLLVGGPAGGSWNIKQSARALARRAARRRSAQARPWLAASGPPAATLLPAAAPCVSSSHWVACRPQRVLFFLDPLPAQSSPTSSSRRGAPTAAPPSCGPPSCTCWARAGGSSPSVGAGEAATTASRGPALPAFGSPVCAGRGCG